MQNHNFESKQKGRDGPLQGLCRGGERQMKDIATAIKLTSGIVKALKAASGAGDLFVGIGSSGGGVVIAMKAVTAIANGVKLSKSLAKALKLQEGTINNKLNSPNIKPLIKGLKASDGALELVKLARGIGKAGEGNGVAQMLNWKCMYMGYKASKSAISIVEAFLGGKGGSVTALGKQGFVFLKSAVGGIGVMMKAAFLSKEACIMLLKVCGASTICSQNFGHGRNSSTELSSKRTRTSEASSLVTQLRCSWFICSSGQESMSNLHSLQWNHIDAASRSFFCSSSLTYLLASSLAELDEFHVYSGYSSSRDAIGSGFCSTYCVLSLAIPCP